MKEKENIFIVLHKLDLCTSMDMIKINIDRLIENIAGDMAVGDREYGQEVRELGRQVQEAQKEKKRSKN